jgi:nuclease-like protein
MLNETLICEGYANAETRYSFQQAYMDRFRACERQAREQGKGLWGEGLTGQPASAPAARPTARTGPGKIKGNPDSKIYHLTGCPNYASLSKEHTVWFATEAAAQQAGYHKAKNCP